MMTWVAILGVVAAGQPARPDVAFGRQVDQLAITVGGRPYAVYFQKHGSVARPFFAHVTTPAGVPVTRTFPPVAGQDKTDHPAMHPGIWLAFGQLGGADFWRNKGPRVVHESFVEGPTGGAGEGLFAVANRYEAGDKVLARETTHYRVVARPTGTLLVVESSFTTDDPVGVAFGDQEEMGLGVRLASPLSVAGGGRMTNADGGRSEKGIWGKPADWCDARNDKAGVLVMADPTNFRKPWWHVRDYGLVLANPFGRNAFTKGEPSAVVLKPGESLWLRFGVLAYDGEVDPKAEFGEFVARLAGR